MVGSGILNQQCINSLKWDQCINILKGGTLGTMWSELERNTDQDYDTVKLMNPALFAIKANAKDNPT
jgi:hypothetical protein